MLKELRLNLTDCGWVIKDQPISRLLKQSRVVVAGVSSVALEALANRCTVLLPVLADYMFLSPLNGFTNLADKVYNPEQLRSSVLEALESRGQEQAANSGIDFINRYWLLDDSLKNWTNILNHSCPK